MATAKATTNHDEIRKWVEARKGRPARVKATGRGKDPGILRIDFPGFSGEDTLEEIEWDEFFEWFDRNNLALLLSGERGNRFNKLVARTTAKKSGSAKKASSTKKASTSAKKSSGGAKKSSAKKSSSTKKASASSAKKATPAKKSSAKKSTAKKSSAKKATPAKTATSTKKAASPRRAVAASTSRKSAAKKSSAKKSSARKTSSKKTTTSGGSKTTTNRTTIRKWVEARGGFPATVAGTEDRGEEAGLLRIDYPGYSGADTLERIEWDDWFAKFDAEKLAFIYQDKKNSRFSKLVRR